MAKEQIDNYEEEIEKIDIMGLMYEMSRAFRKFFFLVFLIVALLGGGSAFWEWKNYTPVYEAYTSFVVTSGQAYTSSYYDNATADQLGKTFPYVLTSGVLRDVVARDLGISAVYSTIRAEVMEGTNLFTISVRDSSAQQAYDVLQSVIVNYPQVAEYIIGSTTLTVVDESGVPTVPINPRSLTRAGIKGALAGIVIAAAFLLVYVTRRKTIRQGEDLKQFTSVKFLGNIPQARIKKRSNLKGQAMNIDNPRVPDHFREAVRLVRSRVEKAIQRNGCKVILVTSSIPGEGKTTIAINLAMALAQKNERVILVDGDLRNPSVARELGMKNRTVGIAEILCNKAELAEALVTPDKSRKLQVLPGVGSVSNPVGLIRSDRMKEILGSMKKMADYIIIDTPPSAMLSDAAAFSGMAHGAVMVIRQDFTGARQVQKGLETISDAGIPVAGYVLNCVTEGTTGYGYSSYGRYGYRRYGYGYGYGKYGYGQSSRNERKKEDSREIVRTEEKETK